MTSHDDQPTSSERTPLLAGDLDRVTSPKAAASLAQSDVPSESDLLPQAEAQSNANDDEETDNRLYEGMPSAVQNLKWTYPALLIGVFLASADLTLVATSWSAIGSELHALNNTSWITTAFSAMIIACHPLYGRLSDIFGRKPCILSAYFIFGIGVTLCGFARNIGELAVARAIAGAGGGGMNSVVSIIVADVVPMRNRPAWFIYTSIAWFVGSALGAPLGGFLVDTVGWRWSFWCQLPLVIIAFVAVAALLHLPAKEEQDHWTIRVSQVDFTGSILLLCGIFALLITLDSGSNNSWTARRTLIAGAIAIPLCVGFICFELYGAKIPIMPLRTVLNRNTIPIHVGSGFLQMACFNAFNMFSPLYLIGVKHYSVTDASLALLPRAVGMLIGNIWSSAWLKRRGTYWRFMVWTWLACAMCYFGMLASVDTVWDSAVALMGFFALASIFGGAFGGTANIALVANSSYADQGVNLGAMYFYRSLGLVWGVSSSATIINTDLRYLLASRLSARSGDFFVPIVSSVSPTSSSFSLNFSSSDSSFFSRPLLPGPDEIADHVRKDLGYVDLLPPKLAKVVIACYSRAIATSFAFNCAMTLLAGVATWFIIERPIDKRGKT